jgi:hypothetical protein
MVAITMLSGETVVVVIMSFITSSITTLNYLDKTEFFKIGKRKKKKRSGLNVS